LFHVIWCLLAVIFMLIPGQSQSRFLDEKQDVIKLSNSIKNKNVKIDFFIL